MTDRDRNEAERILALAKGDALRAFEIVERQLSVLVTRTQVLLSLSGIVITVTGFSGRAIAETSTIARVSITAGILIVLLAAAAAIRGVLRLTWLTEEIVDDPIATLVRAIQLRRRKSAYLAAALALFILGFGLYCAAIAQLLWAAHPRT